MNTTAQVKQAIKKTPQQFVDPLELLKTAKDQIMGPENGQQQTQESITSQNNGPTAEENDYKQKISEQDGRHLQALETELKDIRRQKTFKSLMQKINSGIDVFLEEFSELSYEQKDVLKAQIEAVRTRNSQPVTDQLIEPISKKGRQMFGQKQSAQKQTTRVEKPVPPSG